MVFVVSKFFQTVGNFIWLNGVVCAKNPVPKSEHVAVVRVGKSLLVGMVDFVPAGCGKYQPAIFFQPIGETHVGVLHDQQGQRETSVNHKRSHRNAHERHPNHVKNPLRQDDINGMKSKHGGSIQIGVGMVDAVEAPQERRFMLQIVEAVAAEINQQDAQNGFHRRRQRDLIEQTELVFRRVQHREHHAAANQAVYGKRNERDAEVVQIVPPLVGRFCQIWHERFEAVHQHEQSDEQQRLKIRKRFYHGNFAFFEKLMRKNV